MRRYFLLFFLHPFATKSMFAILPQTEDFVIDDAEYFNDEETAYDAAWDWSAELNGVRVNVYQEGVMISQVFA